MDQQIVRIDDLQSTSCTLPLWGQYRIARLFKFAPGKFVHGVSRPQG